MNKLTLISALGMCAIAGCTQLPADFDCGDN
jgi:hypothetical protein